MNRKHFLLGIIAFAAIFLGVYEFQHSATRKTATNGETHKEVVRFGTGLMAVDYAPFYVAKKFGWYDEALKEKGFGTSYTVFQGPAPANEAMAANSIDVVVIAEPPVIVGKAAGIDIKIAGISAILTQEILVRSQSNIKSTADLKGKKVAVVVGSSSQYGLVKAIEEAGLKPTDVQVINMLPPDAKAAFDSGSIDAWAVWPPWVEEEEVAGTGRVLPGPEQVINSLLTVRGGFATEHPDLLAVIQQVHERAKQWIIQNPDQAQKIVAEALNEPLNVIAKAWPRHNWAASLSDTVLQDLQNKANFLKQQGIINANVDVRQTMLLKATR